MQAKTRIPHLGEVLVVKRNKWGIQGSNRRDKPWKRTKRTKDGRLIPFVKFCLRCHDKRVFHHHKYCDNCHRILQEERLNEGR